MFKSKLQEYCQAKAWLLPEYSTTREGYDHCPRFKASVIVNGATFFSPSFSKSSKDAHNSVAKLAFEYLTGSLSGSPASVVPSPSSTPQQLEANEPVQATQLSMTNLANSDNMKLKDMARLYKNQLQVYAQKRNLQLPVYTSEREGPPHAPRFKSKVMLEGKTYECQEYFCTVKDSENAAAKIALMSVSSDGIEEEDPGFFKNLLQELAQKGYSCLPEYNTASSGPSHAPVFISTVEIKDESFVGQEAKTKKLAEMYAAKVAYSALKERANQKGAQPMDVVMQPVGTSNIDQSMCRPKAEGLPSSLEPPFSRAPSCSSSSPAQPPSIPALSNNNGPRASPHAMSAHKKIIVFPRMPNMTLPPGAKIEHEDERWISVTMDSADGELTMLE